MDPTKPNTKENPAEEPQDESVFGFLVGKIVITGDIESPIPVEWDYEPFLPPYPPTHLSLL
jgi:hypothetical protein